MKRMILFLVVALLSFSFASCTLAGPQRENGNDPAKDTNNVEDEKQTSVVIPQGDPVPTFTVDWPSEMLPADFPNLGKVTKVNDSRAFIKKITIYWNMVSEEQMHAIVDTINAYLDYDHVWQDYFYSDGIKYAPGTEDELIRIVVRYSKTASGEIEPDLNPQFYLEISGPGIPD